MRLSVTEEMARSMAAMEDGFSVAVGRNDVESFYREVEERTAGEAEKEVYVGVLSQLICMARRAAGLSREQLAARAQVDAAEVFMAEERSHVAPEPRVVSRIARALGLPPGRLQQLAGHVTVVDPGLSRAAYRFAASSGSMAPLSKEQRDALNEFVKELAER